MDVAKDDRSSRAGRCCSEIGAGFNDSPAAEGVNERPAPERPQPREFTTAKVAVFAAIQTAMVRTA